MEFIRKFGLWVAAALIALAAMAVYFVAVPGLAKQHKLKWTTLEQSRDSLKKWAKDPASIPNEAKVTEALRVGKQVTLQLDDCGKYLGRQPRRCQTRSFFEDEHAEQPVEIPLTKPGAWREAYAKNNDELRKQLADAGFGAAFPVQTLDNLWGTAAPTPDQITAAMELFWFQKDLADFVTEQVEKDLAAYMTLKAAGRADPFPAKPSDLVINRRPGHLDDLLRSKSRKQLAAILAAIVVDTEERDLATIFNTYLPDEGAGEPTADNGFPWERKGGQEKPSVLGCIIDETQKNFLTEMLPPDKDDLADHQRFMDYIMELRTLRYRQDVIGLLESQKNFEDLAKSLKKGTEEEYARVLADFGKEDLWSATRLAQAIAAVVSIKDEKDYRLVRNNHSQSIAGLEAVTTNFSVQAGQMGTTPAGGSRESMTGRFGGPMGVMATHNPYGGPMMMHNPYGGPEAGPSPSGGRLGGMAMLPPGAALLSGETELYTMHAFSMRVKVEFKRIPIFLRRLLSNSWRYRVQFSVVAPSAGGIVSAESGRGMPGGGQMMPGGAQMMRGGGQMMPTRTPGGEYRAGVGPRAAPSPTFGLEPEIVEAGHYAWIELQGGAFQFTPLLPKTTAKPAGTVAPAPPSRTAAPAPSPGSAAPAPPSGSAAPAPPSGSAAPAPSPGSAAPAPPSGTAAPAPSPGTAAPAPPPGTAAPAPPGSPPP